MVSWLLALSPSLHRPNPPPSPRTNTPQSAPSTTLAENNSHQYQQPPLYTHSGTSSTCNPNTFQPHEPKTPSRCMHTYSIAYTPWPEQPIKVPSPSWDVAATSPFHRTNSTAPISLASHDPSRALLTGLDMMQDWKWAEVIYSADDC